VLLVGFIIRKMLYCLFFLDVITVITFCGSKVKKMNVNFKYICNIVKLRCNATILLPQLVTVYRRER